MGKYTHTHTKIYWTRKKKMSTYYYYTQFTFPFSPSLPILLMCVYRYLRMTKITIASLNATTNDLTRLDVINTMMVSHNNLHEFTFSALSLFHTFTHTFTILLSLDVDPQKNLDLLGRRAWRNNYTKYR